jgi:putative endonuclease
MFNWFKKSTEPKKPKTLGQLGEEFAQAEYKKSGYKVIAANFFNPKGLRRGEIDFIAKNKKNIVFVEVKTRAIGEGKFGSAAEAVNYFKQQKLLKAVKIFLLQNQQYQSLQPQIDVCVVEYGEFDKMFRCAKIISNAVEDWN